jgi:methionine transaminase
LPPFFYFYKSMSKLPQIKTSIFSKMSLMAKEHDAINLSQGFPDFPIDQELSKIVEKSVRDNIHQYCPSNGHLGLLDQIGGLIHKSYNRNLNTSEELLVTAGATQAIFTSIQALVYPGDEVIILDPSYDCYIAPIELCKGIPVRIPLGADFLPDWALINKHVSSKTKMIITNNPHNPSGRTWNDSDMNELGRLLDHYPNLYLLSDEVYEYITFENNHLSAHLYEALKSKSIVVSSFGKTLHVTGWKMGYLVAEKKIMDEIKKIHQYMVFSVNSLCQHVIFEYLKSNSLQDIGRMYQAKRNQFRLGLEQSRFKILPCDGTYFQTLDYSNISDKHDVEFAEELTKKFGVTSIPISVFSENNTHKNILRFCFAKQNETLEKATSLLCKI